MLRQAENTVIIEGILSEIDLKKGSFINKTTGQATENISGTIKVRLNDKDGKQLEIPVSMYSNKYTKNGAENPSYTSIENILTNYVSIASCGSEDKADKVRVSGASLTMNEYYAQDGRLVSYPRIRGSFCTRVKSEEFKPRAEFTAEFMIVNMGDTVDSEGNVTGYEIKGVIPGYGGKIDILPFRCASESVKNAISDSWNVGDSVYAVGRLNFSQTVEVKTVQLGFGEPREERHTVSVSEILITGGNPTPMDETTAFDRNDIQAAINAHKAELENMKQKAASQKAAPAPTASAGSSAGFDLGF